MADDAEREALSEQLERLRSMLDLLTPWAMAAALGLRLPQAIADGAECADDLARAVGADAGGITRLLRYLALRGLVTEPEPRRFRLTRLGELLREDHPADAVRHLRPDSAQWRINLAWAGLPEAVRTGRAGYRIVHGRTFWADIEADPGFAESFSSLVSMWSDGWIPALAAAWPWHDARHVVDLGGGAGDVLISLLGTHPHLRGTLLDLPEAVGLARPALAAAGLSGRCAAVEGSFFDPLPEGGDVYLLAHCLHNWPDDACAAILRRCAEAVGDTARLLLAELFAPEDGGGGDAFGVSNDLTMFNVFGSGERTESRHRELLAGAGLEVRSITPFAGRHLIECAAPGGPPARSAAPPGR
ncbi:methyltransferase [Nocardiopsis mangrovi]|uniref:Methyltransferase n=1 Tax=Nocardiopsis mangrovi TaxID=1179818 RepID=A0ABV9E3R0_9ACTN